MSVAPTSGHTIGDRIDANLTTAGDRPMLMLLDAAGGSESYTYSQLVGGADVWRRFFQSQGLTAGDRVIVILPHSLDLYTSYLGAVLGGLVSSMFAFPSAKYSKEAYFRTVGDLIANADAALLLCLPQLAVDLKPLIAARGHDAKICTCDEVPRNKDGEVANVSPGGVDPNAVAFVQYSSGTTGLKKGVGITHEALLWQIDHYADAIDLAVDDRIVSWLPLYHDMGLIACYWIPLIKAVPIVAMSALEWVRRPGMLLEAITRFGATLCWQPNFAYNLLARAVPDQQLAACDLSSMRGFVNCSEPIMAASHEAFLSRFAQRGLRESALWSSYALAENVFAVTSGTGADDSGCAVDHIDARTWSETGQAVPIGADRPGARAMVSSGRALPGTEIKVVGSHGRAVADRVVGQIAIQSPCLMRGYVNNPGATRQALNDGWYHTGDTGYLLEGHLFVAGRCKDTIIVAGRNIYPQDIEAIVNDVPGVIPGRCVAFGVADESLGTERVVILVESHTASERERHPILDEIHARVAGQANVVVDDVRLFHHKWLSKSTSGKIARTENRNRYLALARSRLAAQNSDPSSKGSGAAPIQERVAAIVRRAAARIHLATTVPPPGPGLISSGVLDSMALVRLILDLETEFGVTIPADAQSKLEHFDSVGIICKLIDDLRENENRNVKPEVAAADAEMSVRDRKCLDFIAGPKNYDLLLLGSSRVQSLSARLAGAFGYRSYNFSVFSARAEDWYCIYRFVVKHNRVPLRHVILGIDVEAFTVGNGMDHRLTRSLYLSQFLDEADRADADQEAAAEVPPPQRDRFRQVLHRLRSQKADGWRRHGYDSTTGNLVYLDNDDVSRKHNQREPLKLEDDHSYDLEYEMRLASFGRLNPKRLKYFVELVQACLDRGTFVSCFLTPLHPELYRHLTARTVYGERMSELLAGLSKNRLPRFELHDFTTPVKFGGWDDDFINAANADRLLERLLGAAVDRRATA